MRRGNVLDLEKEAELGELDEDLLNIRQKGMSNLKFFVSEYITGIRVLSILSTNTVSQEPRPQHL